MKKYWEMTAEERLIWSNAHHLGVQVGRRSARYQLMTHQSADFRAGHRRTNLSMAEFRRGDTGLLLPKWNVQNIHLLSQGPQERTYNRNTVIRFDSRGHDGVGGDGSGVTTFTISREPYFRRHEKPWYDLITGVYSFDPRDGDKATPILELVSLDLTEAVDYSYNWGTRNLVQQFLHDNGSRVWFIRDQGAWYSKGNLNWMLAQDDWQTVRRATYEPYAGEKVIPRSAYYRQIDLMDDVSDLKAQGKYRFPATAMLRYDRDAGGWLNVNTGKSIASYKHFRNNKQRRSGAYKGNAKIKH